MPTFTKALLPVFTAIIATAFSCQANEPETEAGQVVTGGYEDFGARPAKPTVLDHLEKRCKELGIRYTTEVVFGSEPTSLTDHLDKDFPDESTTESVIEELSSAADGFSLEFDRAGNTLHLIQTELLTRPNPLDEKITEEYTGPFDGLVAAISESGFDVNLQEGFAIGSSPPLNSTRVDIDISNEPIRHVLSRGLPTGERSSKLWDALVVQTHNGIEVWIQRPTVE